MAPNRIYQRLIRGDDSNYSSLSPEARPHVAANALRHMGAQALQSIGDQVVNAKTVLPWLLSALGAPGAFVAFLVPFRESGSMLPQAAWAPRVRTQRQRKWVWVAGAVGQAVATAGMAIVAAVASGWIAGVGVLACLAVFALARSLSSIASKDVLGRTIPKGQRGQIKGVTTVASAVVALTLGLALRTWGGDSLGAGVLAALLGGAALAWVVAAVIYASIREPHEEVEAADAGWSGRASPGGSRRAASCGCPTRCSGGSSWRAPCCWCRRSARLLWSASAFGRARPGWRRSACS